MCGKNKLFALREGTGTIKFYLHMHIVQKGCIKNNVMFLNDSFVIYRKKYYNQEALFR